MPIHIYDRTGAKVTSYNPQTYEVIASYYASAFGITIVRISLARDQTLEQWAEEYVPWAKPGQNVKELLGMSDGERVR